MRVRTMFAVVSSAATLAVVSLTGAPANAGPAPGPDPGSAATAPAFHRYVALGDSYTAAPLVPTTSPANGCFRSDHNYPSDLAAALHPATFVDVSCSGARTSDMYQSQNGAVPPQLDAVTPDTDLVSVSIGGNDEQVFGTLVTYCPTLRAQDPSGAPCRTAMRSHGEDRLLAAVHRTAASVTAVVRRIHALAPQATVLVVGYPEIAPRQGTCPNLLPLATGDYRYANQVNLRLTQALRHAAAVTGSRYVDVWRSSQGHDVCATDPWINGRTTDFTRAQAFHPFAEEQAAVASLMLQELTGP